MLICSSGYSVFSVALCASLFEHAKHLNLARWMMDERPGCLGGLLRLALLAWFFDFLQDRFGFGRGCSCTGIGCGCLLLLLFLLLACYVLFTTEWWRLMPIA